MLAGPARAVDLNKGAWLFGRGSRERSSVYWLLDLMAILPNIVALWDFGYLFKMAEGFFLMRTKLGTIGVLIV